MSSIETPATLAAREQAVYEEARAELERQGRYLESDDTLLRQYAAAVVTADHLTAESRRLPAESRAANILAARASAERRNAAALATKLGLTPASRRGKDARPKMPSLLAALEEEDARLAADPEHRAKAEADAVKFARWDAAHALTGRPMSSHEEVEAIIEAAGDEGEDLAARMMEEALEVLHAGWERDFGEQEQDHGD